MAVSKLQGSHQQPLEPKWWNGRHASLRSWCSQGRPGSTPGFGTTTRSPLLSGSPSLASLQMSGLAELARACRVNRQLSPA